MSSQRFIIDLDRVAWRDLDDDVAVFDIVTGDIRVLTGAAAVLWRAMPVARAPHELVEALQAEYDVPDDLAIVDVDDFLGDCARLGMVREVGGDQP